MEIKWTYSATKDLKKVYKFYLKTTNQKIAKEIIRAIFKTTQILESGISRVGQKEQLLNHLDQGHRYLLVNHTKIIYLISNECVYITHVFDTRQNPSKLK